MKKIIVLAFLALSGSLLAYDTYEAPYEGTRCIIQGWAGGFSHGVVKAGQGSPYKVGAKLAYGLDIPGSFEVLAPADGTVVKNGWHSGMGNYVIIKHSDGLYSQYAHLKAKSSLKETNKISKGNLIGISGNTGSFSKGDHLHIQFSTKSSLITDLESSRYVQINGWNIDNVWSISLNKSSECTSNEKFTSKNSKTTTSSSTSPKTINSIEPTCPATMDIGDIGSCTAKAYYSDGTNMDITKAVSWSVITNPSVLKVTSGGKLAVVGAEKNTTARVKITYPKATANGVDIVINGLDGQNHKTYKSGLCSKNVSKVTSKIPNGTLDLFYSNTCKTKYAILTPIKSSLKTTVQIARDDGIVQPYSGTGTIYTPMLFSPVKKVCAYGSVGGGSETKGSCK